MKEFQLDVAGKNSIRLSSTAPKIDFKDSSIGILSYFDNSPQPFVIRAELRIMETNQIQTTVLDVPVKPGSQKVKLVVEADDDSGIERLIAKVI